MSSRQGFRLDKIVGAAMPSRASRASESTTTKPSRFRDSAIDDIAFAAIVLGLLLGPFCFGGNLPLSWGIQGIWFPAASLLYEVGRLIAGRRHPIAIRRIGLSCVCIGAVTAWAAMQIYQGISEPYQHPLWQMARDALHRDLPGAISINVDETMLSLVRLGTAVCVFWTTMQLCHSARRAHQLVTAVAAIGALYASYVVISFFVFPGAVLWYEKWNYTQAAPSKFAYSNTYATYAGIGLIASIALAIDQFAAFDGVRSTGRKIAGVVAAMTGPGGVWLAAAGVIVVAATLTAARGGIFSTFGGLAALLALIVLRRRGKGVVAGIGALTAMAIVGSIAYVFGDAFANRLELPGFNSQDRLAVYRLGILSILDAPYSGSGWGTFRDVFPMYRDSSLGPFGVWNVARNTYVEEFQGLGIPAASILLVGVGVLVGRTIYGSFTRKHGSIVPIVATAATFIVSLEAFVDYGIQIQAVALTWTAILAAGVAQSWSRRELTDR